MICEKIAPGAQRRMSQSQFFKSFRQLAPATGISKSYCYTSTCEWRGRRYSNRRSGYSKLPFEISTETPADHGKSATGEKFARRLRIENTHLGFVSLLLVGVTLVAHHERD
jgi:hypothetical protein